MVNRPLLFPAIASVFFMVAAPGCRPPECQQMSRCCEELSDLEALGATCHSEGADTRDPTTCRDVLRTIGYMLQDRGEAIPPACRL